MADNYFKIKPNKKKSLFARIDDTINMPGFLEDGIPVKYIPYVLFMAFLGVIYIGNSHYGEVTQRKISKLEVKVDNLRADYTTLKADYMYARLQSEVARKIKDRGLEESVNPPVRIEVSKSEY